MEDELDDILSLYFLPEINEPEFETGSMNLKPISSYFFELLKKEFDVSSQETVYTFLSYSSSLLPKPIFVSFKSRPGTRYGLQRAASLLKCFVFTLQNSCKPKDGEVVADVINFCYPFRPFLVHDGSYAFDFDPKLVTYTYGLTPDKSFNPEDSVEEILVGNSSSLTIDTKSVAVDEKSCCRPFQSDVMEVRQFSRKLKLDVFSEAFDKMFYIECSNDLIIHQGLVEFDRLIFEGKISLSKEEFCRWIDQRGNRNYIDVTIPTDIHDRVVIHYLNLLEDDEERGVLFLNNFFAFTTEQNGSTFVVKVRCDQTGVANLCIWDEVNLRKTMSYMFYIEYKTKKPYKNKRKRDEEEIEEQELVEKRIYWLDTWFLSVKRAFTKKVSYRPWSILEGPGLEKNVIFKKTYQPCREINSFPGYRWNTSELASAAESDAGERHWNLFKKLIHTIFCSSNSDYSEFMLNWFAYVIQKPHLKSKVAVIIKSPRGIGKGFIGKIMSHIWGPSFYVISGQALDSKFNDYCSSRKFLFFDEVSRYFSSTTDYLKSLITEESIRTEQKFRNAKIENNYIEFMGATNNDVKLELTMDNRRFFVVEVPTMSEKALNSWKNEIQQVYDDVFDPSTNQIGVQSIFYNLLKRDIEDWVPWAKIPVTPYMVSLMENSLHPVIVWWKHILENRGTRGFDSSKEFLYCQTTKLEESPWKWAQLHDYFRNDEVFLKRRLVNSLGSFKITEFVNQMKEVVSYSESNIDKRNAQVRLCPWESQYSVFKARFPLLTLLARTEQLEESNVFARNYKANIVSKTRLPANVLEMTDEEKNFVIYSMAKALKKKRVETKFNNSFYTRGDNDQCLPLVDFKEITDEDLGVQAMDEMLRNSRKIIKL